MSQREVPHEYRSSETGAAAYDAEYYHAGFGPTPYEHSEYWLGFFGSVADALIKYLNPRTAFDAGCAMGFLVEALRDRGVEAWGADISDFAIQNVREDIRPYCRVASITKPIEGRYDLVACIEVLEHLTPDEASRAIANMAAATDVILLSSTPSDFSEPTHINVRPPIDWLQQFAAAGFSPDLAFDTSVVSAHALLLRKTAPSLPHEFQVFLNDAILLKSAIALQSPEVPAPAQVTTGQLRDAFTKTLEIIRIGAKVDEFVRKNTEMGQVIDGISAVNVEMVKRNADLERRNEELSRQIAMFAKLGPGVRSQEPEVSPDFSNTPHDAQEEKLVKTFFDRSFYLERNSDVRKSGMDPFEHFMEFGACEGRSPHPLFDSPFYLAHHPEVAQAGMNPVLHYLRIGVHAGANPHPLFDTFYYVDEYSDVAESGVNPLFHFLEHGAQEGRNPHPFFNTAAYLAANPDIAADGNALIDYVTSGAAEGRPLRIPVSQEDRTPYAIRISRIEPDAQELQLQRAVSRQFLRQPVISVVVPAYRVPLPILKAMVESVRMQTYFHWELCLAHGDPEDVPARAWLRSLAQDDRRIKVELLTENLGISGNSNRALALASGDYVGLLDHDDTLAPFALYEAIKVINEKPDVDFIYSDKDLLNEKGERVSPLFKPKWSPDPMLSANYVTHFCVMRTEHLRAIGGWRPETDGAQDWDLFLRVIERSRRIEFIDKVLYHWRMIETSVAFGGLMAKPYAAQGQLQTISERLSRLGVKGKPTLQANGAMRVLWELPPGSLTGNSVPVSIILVSGESGVQILERGRQVRASIAHWPVEVVVAAPDVAENRDGDILTVTTPEGAHLAQRLNAAVAASRGWSIIFLDDCVNVSHPDWLLELLGPLQLDKVAMVSPQLIDPPTKTVRHAGIVFNRDGDLSYIFAGESQDAYGVFAGPSWCRNWSAVSGACFAIRRSVFDQVGGFVEDPRYPRLDIDLCLRVTIEHGWRIFYNAYAQFPQHGPSRLEMWLRDDRSIARQYARLCFPLGDPYFHPRLKCVNGKVSLDFKEDQAPPPIDYALEARVAASGCDFSPAALAESRNSALSPAKHVLERVSWFVPDFANPFYGGIHTILRAADYMHRVHRVHSTFVTPCPEAVIRSIIQAAFPDLAGECGLMEFTSYSQLPSVPACDAAIATLWTTAYSVLRMQNARRKFYFMQDYETRFYPAGSISALVEATYHFGFPAICNTVSLRDIYTKLGGHLKNDAEYFDPCVDGEIFHANNRAPRSRMEPLTLFCYARPTHPRNSFELLSEALRIAKRRLGGEVRIVTAGAEWSPRQYGLEGIVHNLGLLPYSATGALYRACTAGVALMMTCHPSYLPFELMACGALVITNSNPYNSWLLKDHENCLLAETSPTALADALEEGLRNHALRETLVANAARMIQERYSDWDAQMERIYRYMVEIC